MFAVVAFINGEWEDQHSRDDNELKPIKRGLEVGERACNVLGEITHDREKAGFEIDIGMGPFCGGIFAR